MALATTPGLALLIDAAVAIKCFGVATSYLIVIGDSMPAAMHVRRTVFKMNVLERKFHFSSEFLCFIVFAVISLCGDLAKSVTVVISHFDHGLHPGGPTIISCFEMDIWYVGVLCLSASWHRGAIFNSWIRVRALRQLFRIIRTGHQQFNNNNWNFIDILSVRIWRCR